MKKTLIATLSLGLVLGMGTLGMRAFADGNEGGNQTEVEKVEVIENNVEESNATNFRCENYEINHANCEMSYDNEGNANCQVHNNCENNVNGENHSNNKVQGNSVNHNNNKAHSYNQNHHNKSGHNKNHSTSNK